MARNYFTLAGTDSRDFGVYINGQGTFNAPSRSYDFISIPGRNGDLIGTEKRLDNVELTYHAFIYHNFEQNIEDFRSFLLSLIGYQRLTDSYHADEFRLVAYEGPFEADVVAMNNAGEFDVTFNCKPQRFLTSGEAVTTLTANGSITNPTRFNSQPLLRVYGKGVLGIGSQSITILSADTYTDIDCEMMDAYKGTASRNAYIQLSDYNFPTFAPGRNNIRLGSGITRVEITPRWFVV